MTTVPALESILAFKRAFLQEYNNGHVFNAALATAIVHQQCILVLAASPDQVYHPFLSVLVFHTQFLSQRLNADGVMYTAVGLKQKLTCTGHESLLGIY